MIRVFIQPSPAMFVSTRLRTNPCPSERNTNTKVSIYAIPEFHCHAHNDFQEEEELQATD